MLNGEQHQEGVESDGDSADYEYVDDRDVGDRSRILKFSYAYQDPSMEYTSNEGK